MRYTRNPQVLAGQVGSEVVLLSMEVESYFALNGPASAIWDLLAQPMTREELIDRLTSSYRVAPETCEREVAHFLATLVDRRLVDVTTD